MAKSVVIVGPSGVGKSASMRNLDPATTFLINVNGKDLPFRSKGFVKTANPKEGNVFTTDISSTIFKAMQYISENRPEIKRIVVDDAQYASANDFMRKISVKGFEKFNEIGQNIWMMGNILSSLRDDLIVYYLMHEEATIDSFGNKRLKVKTIGRLIDEKVTFEGMFTTVLWADAKMENGQMKRVFITQTDGTTTAKSPMEMFTEMEIPNDLAIVDATVREYYEIN
jgi:hypothetical protein